MAKNFLFFFFNIAGLTMLISCSTVSKSSEKTAVGGITGASGKRCSADTLIPGSNPPAYESECGSLDNPGYCYVAPGENSGTCRFLQFAQKRQSHSGQSCIRDRRDGDLPINDCGEWQSGWTCLALENQMEGHCVQFSKQFENKNWVDAAKFCDEMMDGGYNWRLPTHGELYALTRGAIIAGKYYWYSTRDLFEDDSERFLWTSSCYPSGKVGTVNAPCQKQAYNASAKLNATFIKLNVSEKTNFRCIHDGSQRATE